MNSFRIVFIIIPAIIMLFISCNQAQIPAKGEGSSIIINRMGDTLTRVSLTEEEWRSQLNPVEYKVLREEGTERAFTGEYWNHKGKGVYVCRGCGLPLFSHKTKYDSGTGWPSFYEPLDSAYVARKVDYKIGVERTEVHCARCGGHLGHVFEDGPPPTGLRYCINSVSLGFSPLEE